MFSEGEPCDGPWAVRWPAGEHVVHSFWSLLAALTWALVPGWSAMWCVQPLIGATQTPEVQSRPLMHRLPCSQRSQTSQRSHRSDGGSVDRAKTSLQRVRDLLFRQFGWAKA